MEALFILLGLLGLGAIAIIYSAFAYGFLVYKFYYWFILPVFHDLPQISIPAAIGIGLFISLFKGAGSSNDYTYKGETIKSETKWGTLILMPWLTLGAAYLIKCVFL